MYNQVSPIVKALLEGSNDPPVGCFVFDSDDHIRYQDGIDVSGHNYNCHRQIEIKNNIDGGEGYTITIYNQDDIHPLWNTNIQMAPKPMKIVGMKNNVVCLQGFGYDVMGGSFSDYAIDIYVVGEEISKIILKMLDRNVELEYFRKNTQLQSPLDDRRYILNSRSEQMINNVLTWFESYPQYYTVVCDYYEFEEAQAKYIDVYHKGTFGNRYLFYPDADGNINSVALYGQYLQQHYDTISASMKCFDLDVTKIFFDTEGPTPFLDIYVKYDNG